MTEGDRLDSWKEIAAYLKRDVTTVQRWEKREGMPVHRHLHGRMGSVYAYRADLDAWVHSRNVQAAPDDANEVAAPDTPDQLRRSAPSITPKNRRFAFALVAMSLALAIGTSLWFRTVEYSWRNPIADARYQTVTEFDGIEQAAAVSR